MKNLSFWNKTLSAKGKMFAGAALAALTALLALVVCSDNSSNPNPPPDCPATQVGCPGYVPPPAGATQYCYWGPGECYPMNEPNAPCTAPCDAGLTVLQNCQANGFVSNSPTCSDAPTVEYYCEWPTGCYKIANPNAVDPNAAGGLTYLENCAANGKVVDKAYCDSWTPPAVQKFCDWGVCVDGSGWNCASGGCYRYNPAQHDEDGIPCGQWGDLVDQCSPGSPPPAADY